MAAGQLRRLCLGISLFIGTVVCGELLAGSAEPIGPVAYYFPRGDVCTVMMDYEKDRHRLRGLNAEARALELARSMITEWAANAAAKCASARKVTMLAVYIPGVDIYGRPDFGNRTNLLKLEGDAARLQALGQRGNSITMAQVRSNSSVEQF